MDNQTKKYEYQLPTLMKVNDKVTYKCKAADNAKELRFGLLAGCTLPDYNNIVCELVIQFDDEKKIDIYALEVVFNGQSKRVFSEKVDGDYRSNYRDLKAKNYTIAFRSRDDYLNLEESDPGRAIMLILINNTVYEPTPMILFHERNVIKFLTAKGDFQEIEEFKYEFAEGDP